MNLWSHSMTRRLCLTLPAASFATAAKPAARITRITLAPIEGRFHKFVAMNSYDTAPKGHTYSNTLVRIATDQGVEGVGVMGYQNPDPAFLQALQPLLSADPHALYQFANGRITARHPSHAALLAKYRHLDGPLFDLIGKLDSKPAWQLIGDAVRDRIEVYDGTLYFSDIWFRDRGPAAVVEECEEAARKGYLGVKLKLGRGWKWMSKDEGLARDIQVVNAVRNALGPKFKILTDANNGYQKDYDRAWRLMQATAAARLHWMEEIFPESVEDYTRLRADMRRAGIQTPIADGESADQPEHFKPYLQPNRLVDVLQMDIRRGGFLDNIACARLAQAAGATCVPHNWGAQVGLFMGLHIAKAVRAIPAAEDDRSTCDVLIAEGYHFSAGHYTVPDSPGLSLRIDESVYSAKYKSKETVIS